MGGAVDENGELAGVSDGGLGQNAENVPRVNRAWAGTHQPYVRKALAAHFRASRMRVCRVCVCVSRACGGACAMVKP